MSGVCATLGPSARLSTSLKAGFSVTLGHTARLSVSVKPAEGCGPAVTFSPDKPLRAALAAVLQGDQGPSAYQVAVAAGFEGSEALWLASLVGPPGANAGEPVTVSYVNGGATPLRRGHPAALVSGSLRLASAQPGTRDFVGLIYDAEILPGASGRVQVGGIMQQPAAEWDAATGMVGGLAAEETYYLAAAGGMTPFAPNTDGLFLVPIGYATSNTEFLIDPGTPIEL